MGSIRARYIILLLLSTILTLTFILGYFNGKSHRSPTTSKPKIESIITNNINKISLKEYENSLSVADKSKLITMRDDANFIITNLLKPNYNANFIDIDENKLVKLIDSKDFNSKTPNLAYIIRRTVKNENRIYGIQLFTLPTTSPVMLCVYFPSRYNDDFTVKPHQCFDPYIK